MKCNHSGKVGRDKSEGRPTEKETESQNFNVCVL
jgi:hypothetical protein